MTPLDHWHQLLRPDVELAEPFWTEFAGRMRDARLTFGDRLNCPFLRPFFLTEAEAARVTHAAETLARVGEKVVGPHAGQRAGVTAHGRAHAGAQESF